MIDALLYNDKKDCIWIWMLIDIRQQLPLNEKNPTPPDEGLSV